MTLNLLCRASARPRLTRGTRRAVFCERIQSDISQRIINNGVPESSFTLSIVPNDQVDQPDSQVVGHCANDTHKILYTRTTSGNVSAPAQSTQDGAPAEPQ